MMKSNYEDSSTVLDDVSVQTTTFAKKTARNLLKDSKLSKPPILLNDVFKTLDLKISVKGKDLGDDDGFCINDKIIVYNNQKSRNRYRFTVAHELGHILLGHNSGSAPSKINLYSKNEVERNANSFAAELLAPMTLLKKEKLGNMSITDLANKYEVSHDMMQWRLKECRLDLKVDSWK